MKIEQTFLRSKVAQRIFFLFFACALIPITALALISFVSVNNELRDQIKERLHQTSKNTAQEIRQRLILINDELKTAASNLATSLSSNPYYAAHESGTDLPRIKNLMLISEKGETRLLYGDIADAPEISSEMSEQIFSKDMSLILIRPLAADQSRIFMAVPVDPEHKSRDLLLAEIRPDFVWFMGDADTLPRNTHLCVLDRSNHALRSTLLPPISLPEEALALISKEHAGQFEWTHREKKYMTSFYILSLSSWYIADDLKLLLSEAKAVVLGPFKKWISLFFLIALASLWLVLFLSVIQIRRSMVPLEKLKEGTQRIAKREFDSRVKVTSHDEFEEVAESFNTMAGQLGKQFKALEAMGEIDRDILSVLDTEKIVNTVVTRIRDVFPCKSMSITVIDPQSPDKIQTYIGDDQNGGKKHVEKVKISSEEIQTLKDNPETLLISVDENLAEYLVPLAKRGIKSFLVLPLFLKENLAGIISLGYVKQPYFSQEDLDQARRLANQVAVAFSNTRLIEELNELNWGTLRALARAIDAKSSWTAGHSERSTKLSIEIGKAMGLNKNELDNMRRAGLLHDIGKLAIPPEILDKEGILTPEELELMHKHPSMGTRILEPIAAYSEIIPIILQHHEFYDGSGYPNGLMGEAISLGARIFIVADTYDALISDRPYRKALDRKGAIKYIKEEAGTRFDPKVVEVFLSVMAKKGKK
jgi:HD-GYP domain-containing protein (c-di-GMP phosphodiesterase class II)/HAMP domain-containing protein